MRYLTFLVTFVITIPFLWFGSVSLNERSADPDELLYSELAIKRLKEAIEAKNATFRPGISDGRYIAIPQGTAAYLSVSGSKAAVIRNLIAENKSWEKVSAGLKAGEKVENLFFMKSLNSGKSVIFYPVDLNNEDREPVQVRDLEAYNRDLSGTWIYSYSKATDYSKANIEAMYIRSEFKRTILPVSAADCIRYTDHLVDTSTTIFKESAIKNRFAEYKENPAVDMVIKMARTFPGMPSLKGDTSMKAYERFETEYARWEQKRQDYIERELSKNERFKMLLNGAYHSVITDDMVFHPRMDEFESYVEKYISPAAALELKRKRVVVGGCSMDRSPILHAANIARLAGETCCMEIFLRSHLNILYDRFSRMTDGSYAEPGRQTYARELELIGVNLKYLLPGTLFTARNLPANHYRGELNRAGRAIAELESRKEIYGEVERFIQDPELDYYNRLIFIFLAESYNYHLIRNNQSLEAKQNLQNLLVMAGRFPAFIKEPLGKSIRSVN